MTRIEFIGIAALLSIGLSCAIFVAINGTGALMRGTALLHIFTFVISARSLDLSAGVSVDVERIRVSLRGSA